jgi:hypothetical protein
MGWLPWKGKKKKLEQPDEAARKDAAPPPTNSAGNPKSGAAGGSGARYCPPAARLCLHTFFVPTLRLVCCGAATQLHGVTIASHCSNSASGLFVLDRVELWRDC